MQRRLRRRFNFLTDLLKQIEAFCDAFVIVTNNIPNIPQSLYILHNIKTDLIKWTITVHNIYSSKYTTKKDNGW